MVKINRELLSGSLVFLIAFNIYNVLNFAFHFSMARMLSPADYGILAALFSIIYMTGIFSESIQTIVAKYSSGEENKGKLKNLVLRTIKKSLKLSLIVFAAYIFAAIPLSFILKIPYLLLTSTGLIIFSAFLPPITRGALQGTKRFFPLGINFIIEGFIKLSLAVLFVFLGWKVYGAMAGTIIASAIAFIFSIIAIRDIMKSREKSIKTEGIYSYSLPVFFVLFTILLFYSIDIIIAKAVFDPTTAGYYAIASILAKTIFLGTQPISKVMFPLVAEKKNSKGHHLLLNALVLILLCIAAALLMFYFFPDFIIWVFSGKHITESSNILFYLGVAVSLLSLTNLALLYKLSLGKIRNYWIFILFPIIEIALLCIFSHNLIEFSIALITSSAIFLWGSIFFLDR
jgi:O-antigen/teichoic acid export membrane protein